MSRSYRKNFVYGMTTCRSEKADKKIWHSRFRARERDLLVASAQNDFESHMTTHHLQVSNVWLMGKDGKQRWPFENQQQIAEWSADRRARTEAEKSSLKKRLLHKYMGK